MSRVLPNKCFNTRIEIEGKAYRVISFFHTHPSEIPEDQWVVFRYNKSVFLVDKVSFAIMAECQCELLTREQDKSEPTIVSVKLDTAATLQDKPAKLDTAATLQDKPAKLDTAATLQINNNL